MAKFKVLQFTIFLVMISTIILTESLSDSRKLDEAPPDLENKCGNCPCNNPCSPTPPSPPPPSPPPPPKNPTPSTNCPPPPKGGEGGGGGSQYPPNPPYIFINGPPGNLYPIDHFYSGSGRSFSIQLFPFLIGGVLGLLAFF